MTEPRRPVVTISASYGAGGSELGPRLAERLKVPFVDRAIPLAVAERLEVPVETAVDREEVAPATFSRWLAHFAPAVQLFAGAVVIPEPGPAGDDLAFRTATEEVLREYAGAGGSNTGAVILGRGGALVLRDVPGALHVRLDGPPEARLRQAMRVRGVDEETATEQQRIVDRAREAYVRQWYHRDPHDPALYHLVLDSTELTLDCCLELIVLAADRRSQTATS